MDGSNRLEQTSDASVYEGNDPPCREHLEQSGEEPLTPEGLIRRLSLDSLASSTASIENHDEAGVPEILYRVEYQDIVGAMRRSVRDNKPIKIKPRKSKVLENDKDPVIEILTQVERPRSTKFGGQFPQTIHESSLTIYSPQLIKVIRHIIRYYPRLSLEREKLIFIQPYAPLLHYLGELEQYHENSTTPSSRSIGFRDETESALSRYHVGLLLSILRNSLPPKMSLGMVRDLASLRKTTFESLWLLFKPGTDVYTSDDHESLGAVVEGISGGSLLSDIRHGNSSYSIGIWFMEFDGRSVGRRHESLSISSFE
ncbi:MAG: hypothetical protein Q9224_005362, partial [Gallowayella concinna]